MRILFEGTAMRTETPPVCANGSRTTANGSATIRANGDGERFVNNGCLKLRTQPFEEANEATRLNDPSDQPEKQATAMAN